MPTSHSLASMLAAVAFFVFTGLPGAVIGQCLDTGIDIKTGRDHLCIGGSSTYTHIACTSPESPIRFYRDGEEIFNGSALSLDVHAGWTYHSFAKPTCQNNTLTTLVINNITEGDTGNYVCRTTSYESEVQRITAVPRRPTCNISLDPGPIVQASTNATLLCSSATGSPRWNDVGADANAIVVYLNDSLLSVRASLNASLMNSFTCTVTQECTYIAGSEIEQFESTCSQRLLVVENPLDSYLSLSPAVLTVTTGQSGKYYCRTDLSGTTVSLASLDQSLSYTKHSTGSDSTDEITFYNMTSNFTEPIVECQLLYRGLAVFRAVGTVVVIAEPEVLPTTPSLPRTSQPQTLSTSLTSVSRDTLTPLTTNGNTIIASTQNHSAMTMMAAPSTTRVFIPPSSSGINSQWLVVGLVLGLIVFLSFIIVLTLIFRWRATKKGDWHVGQSSNRRSRAEVASNDALEGRLEWETDTNPLVEVEASTSFGPLVIENQGDTEEDDQGAVGPVANGHVAMHDKAQLISVDVIIENVAENGVTNQGFHLDKTSTEEPQKLQRSHEISEQVTCTASPTSHQTTPSDLDSEHCVHDGQSDVLNSDGETNDVEFEMAEMPNFVDVTPFEGKDAYRDADSGFGLSPESVLSEIEEGAINIVAV